MAKSTPSSGAAGRRRRLGLSMLSLGVAMSIEPAAKEDAAGPPTA